MNERPKVGGGEGQSNVHKWVNRRREAGGGSRPGQDVPLLALGWPLLREPALSFPSSAPAAVRPVDDVHDNQPNPKEFGCSGHMRDLPEAL